MTGADSEAFQGVWPECQSSGSRPLTRRAGRNLRGSTGRCRGGWLLAAVAGKWRTGRTRKNGALCLLPGFVLAVCCSWVALRFVGKVQLAVVVGVSDFGEVVRRGGLVGKGLQFVEQGVGEVGVAESDVVGRVVGAHVLKLA